MPLLCPCSRLQTQSPAIGPWASLVHVPVQVCGAPQVPLLSPCSMLQTQLARFGQSRLLLHLPPQVCGSPHVPKTCPWSLLQVQLPPNLRQRKLVRQVPSQVRVRQVPSRRWCLPLSLLQKQPGRSAQSAVRWQRPLHVVGGDGGVSQLLVVMLQTQLSRAGHWALLVQDPAQVCGTPQLPLL